MQIITIKASWNENRDENSKVFLSRQFRELSSITRLDHLSDVIFDLQKLYDETLAQHNRELHLVKGD